jgi:PhnB protein
MTTDLVTYLSFDGHCEAAFKHYEKILGGKILMMARYADAPADAGIPQNPETAARIMHARLQVGDRLLMGGDAPPQFATKPQGFCVSVQVDDAAEAERIFRALGEGGVVQMPLGETSRCYRHRTARTHSLPSEKAGCASEVPGSVLQNLICLGCSTQPAS